MADLVIPRRLRPAQLQPVERRLALQRRQHRVVAKAGRGRPGPRSPARSRRHADRPGSQPGARSAPPCGGRQSTSQTDRSNRSLAPSDPATDLRRPRSSDHRQTPPRSDGLLLLQIQTSPEYTLSASGFLPSLMKVVAPQQLSQSQDSDAPFIREKSGLETVLAARLTGTDCFAGASGEALGARGLPGKGAGNHWNPSFCEG